MNREANIVIPYLIGDTQKKMIVHAEVINNIVYKDMYPAVMDRSNKYLRVGYSFLNSVAICDYKELSIYIFTVEIRC